MCAFIFPEKERIEKEKYGNNEYEYYLNNVTPQSKKRDVKEIRNN